MADVEVSGKVLFGSQQQWMSRNSVVASSLNGVWNIVWVGCSGAADSHCGNDNGSTPTTNVYKSPVVLEKPYIILEGTQFKLMRPKVEFNKVGTTNGWENSDEIDFSNV